MVSESTLAQRRAMGPEECKDLTDISVGFIPYAEPMAVTVIRRCDVKVAVSMRFHVVWK
jgi:hypothetical protein